MEFQYIDDGLSMYSIYWSDGLDSETIEKKYSSYDVLQVWYPLNVHDDIYEQYKLIMSFNEYQGYWKKPAQSLECALTCPADEIIGRMKKNTRYEVQRAIKRDNLHTEVITNISEDDMAEYAAYYDKFADSKKVRHMNRSRVRALVELGMYAITKCRDNGGNILVEHAYYLDQKEKKVMLATSASMFRESENSEYRNLIGRANRMLHYKDILAFKELGYEVYDYGGIGNDNDELKAIAAFKSGFGGDVRTYDASFTLHLKEQRIIDEKIHHLQLSADQKIVIYGFGWAGKYIADKMEKRGISDYIVVDNYKESTDEMVYYKDEDLMLLDCAKTLLLVTLTEKTYVKIEKRLNGLGYWVGDNIVTLLF